MRTTMPILVKRVQNKKKVTDHTQVQVYSMPFVCNLLYDSERWTLYLHMLSLRKIFNIMCKDKVPNNDILECEGMWMFLNLLQFIDHLEYLHSCNTSSKGKACSWCNRCWLQHTALAPWKKVPMTLYFDDMVWCCPIEDKGQYDWAFYRLSLPMHHPVLASPKFSSDLRKPCLMIWWKLILHYVLYCLLYDILP